MINTDLAMSMTVPEPDLHSKLNIPGVSPFISNMNLDIFAVELASWAGSSCVFIMNSSRKSVLRGLGLVESAKKQVMGRLVPRNSSWGRPFSPVGVGGLSAVIGLGGALFGHNGVLDPAAVNQATMAATTQSQVAFVGGNVLASDVMVDSSSLQTIIPEGRARDEVLKHKVEPGETLESIAQEYNVTLSSIKYVNNMGDSDLIKPGQELTILPVSGVLHEVKDGESLESISGKWKVAAQAIVEINWLDEPYTVKAGDKLIIPNAEIPEPTPTPQPARAASPSTSRSGGGAVAGTGRFMFPTNGSITQYYSYYHNGIDIGTMNSTPPIYAADSGRVTFAGWWSGGGGYSVWIDHGNGYVTQYAHMSRISVSAGQSVGRGQQVGLVGDTGLAFGYHLHFNVLQNGRTINPMSVL